MPFFFFKKRDAYKQLFILLILTMLIYRNLFFRVAFSGLKQLVLCPWLIRYFSMVKSKFCVPNLPCINSSQNTGRKGRQDNCCLCWWSWIQALYWYQWAATPSFGWDTSLLWGLYPFPKSQILRAACILISDVYDSSLLRSFTV